MIIQEFDIFVKWDNFNSEYNIGTAYLALQLHEIDRISKFYEKSFYIKYVPLGSASMLHFSNENKRILMLKNNPELSKRIGPIKMEVLRSTELLVVGSLLAYDRIEMIDICMNYMSSYEGISDIGDLICSYTKLISIANEAPVRRGICRDYVSVMGSSRKDIDTDNIDDIKPVVVEEKKKKIKSYTIRTSSSALYYSDNPPAKHNNNTDSYYNNRYDYLDYNKREYNRDIAIQPSLSGSLTLEYYSRFKDYIDIITSNNYDNQTSSIDDIVKIPQLSKQFIIDYRSFTVEKLCKYYSITSDDVEELVTRIINKYKIRRKY